MKELIRKKRDGGELLPADLERLVGAYVRGEIKDYQMASLLMAIFFRGLTLHETSALTRAMWKSGESFPRPERAKRSDYWIDKHSTGGVGDKTSLLLVPIVSSVCQRLFGFGKVRIPMVSGRGLGHSGGTLDKLEAVPGFSPALDMKDALRLLEKNGYVMMGQTPDLAPADRLIYALRDVTSTVESIPLIVSSIMSKKLAESLDGLVLDVKVGSGAFMETEARSRELAGVLMGVAKEQGLDVVTVLTRMDEPLGRMVGNHLEIEECADFLSGGARERGLEEVVLELAAWMVHFASRKKIAQGDAREECRAEIGKPEPVRIFRQMLEAQGGRMSDFEAQRASLRKTLKSYAFRASSAGFVTRVEARALGVLVNSLGGGRMHKEDAVDALVGIECLKKEGDQVAAGETVAMVYYRSTGHENLIEPALRQAVQIGAAVPADRSWILGTFHQ